MLDACTYPLKITPEDKYWIFWLLRFVIKLEHRVSNITQLTCTKLPQVLPMDKIEIKFTNFHRKTTSMFEIGLFYSINMCLICDSYLLTYLLKYFLVLINISINAPEHKVLLSKIVLNPIFIIT